MTTGEFIQLNRKKLGWSQEQLGDKLMVSRQTISLWEKDQTLPTVENLIRLKEIFGVSIDEFLTGEAYEPNNKTPIEQYKFKYNKEEIKSIFSALENGQIPTIIFSALFIAVGFVALWVYNYIPLLSFFLGALAVYVMFNVFIAVKNSSLKKKSTERMTKADIICEVYEDRFLIKAFFGGELHSSFSYKYSELKNVREVGDYFLITDLSIFHIIRKTELPESSLLYRELSTKTLEFQPKQPTRKSRNLFITLVFTMAFSVFLSYIIPIAVSPDHILTFDIMWLNYLFIPVPLALFVLGVRFKSKKIRLARRSLMVGILGIIYFIVMGSLWMTPYIVHPEKSDYNKEHMEQIEQTLGVDFPEAEEIDYIYFNDMEQAIEADYWLDSVMTAYYTKNDEKEIEAQIINNDNWIKKIPNKLIKIEPPLIQTEEYDYVTFYNETENTFNTLPKKETNFYYTCVFYSAENNKIDVFEYQVNNEE